MKRALLLAVLTASCVCAQEKADVVYQTSGSVGAVAFAGSANPVQGAPYSATITNESVQTLADGNRIVQTSTGTTARDSQGRTRQDMALPAIGNLAAANTPHLVLIHDPVAQASYTLNLTEKTAQKLPTPPPLPGDAGGSSGAAAGMRVVTRSAVPLASADPLPVTIGAPTGAAFFQKQIISGEQEHATTEDLGSQTMEGILVNGVRSTRTIPAGEIGNDRPITIVTEVWTSPDLKTVVYSKRSDPRMGDVTFRLSNLVRTEPDPTLFTIPPDFKIVDGPQTILYRAKP